MRTLPTYLHERMVDDMGMPTPSWQSLFDQLFSYLQNTIASNGLKMSQQNFSNTQMLLSQTSTIGNFVYTSDTNQIQVNVNGTPHTVPTSPTGNISLIATSTPHNVTATLLPSDIMSGLIVMNPADSLQVLTFPTAASLFPAMGTQVQGGATSCRFLNVSSNTITLASSDPNLIITNLISPTVAAKSVRDLYFVISNPATPIITVYG